jgi:3-hydroxyacyl-CoA dehydrogenase
MDSKMDWIPQVGDPALGEHPETVLLPPPSETSPATSSSKKRVVQSVAIVGAGMMGTAIAAANVRRSVPVVLADADEGVLATAAARIAEELTREGQSPSLQVAEAVRRLVVTTADDARLGACDLVLESIVEALAAKQQLYARLEPHLAAETLLASNTSTIPIGRLAAKLANAGRFLGLHFFHPVLRRPLLEIVRGPQTAEQTVAAAAAYAKMMEKVPVVVNDGPGFLVNRLLVPYLAEALELLLEGAAIREIEWAATSFGMAMGPLRLMDEIGLDTVLLGGRVLWEAFPERITPSPLLVAMYKSGRLGRKSGAGFFAYRLGQDVDQPAEPAPGVNELIAAWARRRAPASPERIIPRLLLPMVLEATRILEERKVHEPRSIDLAVILGLGFPVARGGLLRWADSLGARRIVAMLDGLAHLGPRVRPTPLLEEMARRRRRFYARAA